MRHLEHFLTKWIVFRVKKTRQDKGLEPGSVSIKTDKALGIGKNLVMTSAVALMAAVAAYGAPALADEAVAKKWIDSEFQPSTLSKEDQMKEMQWFIRAAAPFKSMEINAV